jgi:peptide/nickel transport system permease protein
MFSRIILGSQISLTIGLIGVILSLIFGSVLGIASGYFGGIIDEIIQRLIELVRAFPTIPLWMALSAALPTNWSQIQTYFAVTIILSLIGWTWLARQLRGQVLVLRESDYILAARLSGASTPDFLPPPIPATLARSSSVSSYLSLPSMIMAETSLSFLGLARPPTTSWGVLLRNPRTAIPGALSVVIRHRGDCGRHRPSASLVTVLRDAADPFTV